MWPKWTEISAGIAQNGTKPNNVATWPKAQLHEGVQNSAKWHKTTQCVTKQRKLAENSANWHRRTQCSTKNHKPMQSGKQRRKLARSSTKQCKAPVRATNWRKVTQNSAKSGTKPSIVNQNSTQCHKWLDTVQKGTKRHRGSN